MRAFVDADVCGGHGSAWGSVPVQIYCATPFCDAGCDGQGMVSEKFLGKSGVEVVVVLVIV